MKCKNNNLCVAVLLSTHNGEDYLEEQINSITAQIGVCTHLHIRDDASTDSSSDICKRLIRKDLDTFFLGNRLGLPGSFYALMSVLDAAEYKYMAFADQDDLWLPDKLISGVEILEKNPSVTLYCSERYIMGRGQKLKNRNKKRTDLNLGNLLFENICFGNTFIFRSDLISRRELQYLAQTSTPHDWMFARIAAVRGLIFRDSRSYIYYRLHSKNNTGISSFSKKIRIRIVKKKKILKTNYLSEFELFDLEHLGGSNLSSFIDHNLNSWWGMRKLRLRENWLENEILKLVLSFGYIPQKREK